MSLILGAEVGSSEAGKSAEVSPGNPAAFSQTLHGSSIFVPGSAIGVPQPILPETICMFRDIDCKLSLTYGECIRIFTGGCHHDQ